MSDRKPYWADADLLKYAERYRLLRTMRIIINPFTGQQVSGALLDSMLDRRLLEKSPDAKLPWERAAMGKEASK